MAKTKINRHPPVRERAVRQHHERVSHWHFPSIENDPELKAAYHSLQLHWIRSVPGYREALRQKLSEAAKEADRRARRIESRQMTVDNQYLGPILAAKQREEQLERLAGY